MRKLIARVSSGVWLNPHHRRPLAECLCCRSDTERQRPAHPRGVLARCDPLGASRPEPSPLRDAGGLRAAARRRQGGLEPQPGLRRGAAPQAISPARFFPKLAAASHCYAFFEVWFLDAQRANRGRRLRPPPLQQRRFAHVALGIVVVEPRTGRRRKRGFCAARDHWKSLPHVRGGN